MGIITPSDVSQFLYLFFRLLQKGLNPDDLKSPLEAIPIHFSSYHAKKVYFGAMFIERRGDKKGAIGIKRGQIIKKKA